MFLLCLQILGANDKNGSGENNPFSHSGDERKAVISGSPEAQWKVLVLYFFLDNHLSGENASSLFPQLSMTHE